MDTKHLTGSRKLRRTLWSRALKRRLFAITQNVDGRVIILKCGLNLSVLV